jgi:hypothetical protein
MGGEHRTVEELRRYDPHLTPDDRWKSAVATVAEGRRASTRHDPPEVVEAVAFLRELDKAKDDKGREAVRARWPDLAAARRLYEGDGPLLWEVQARVLAGQTDAEVAAACGLTPGAVGYFETLFFSVRDKLGAPDWVDRMAIRPGSTSWAACGDLGEAWRSLGYHGGLLVLDLVVAATVGRPLPAWVAAREGAGDVKLGERLRLVARMVVDAMLLPPEADPTALLRPYAEVVASGPARGARSPVASVAQRAAGALAALDVNGAHAAADAGVTAVA